MYFRWIMHDLSRHTRSPVPPDWLQCDDDDWFTFHTYISAEQFCKAGQQLHLTAINGGTESKTSHRYFLARRQWNSTESFPNVFDCWFDRVTLLIEHTFLVPFHSVPQILKRLGVAHYNFLLGCARFPEFFLTFLPPTNVVCEGYVLTGVCLSTGGVCLSACWETPLPGRPPCQGDPLPGRPPC